MHSAVAVPPRPVQISRQLAGSDRAGSKRIAYRIALHPCLAEPRGASRSPAGSRSAFCNPVPDGRDRQGPPRRRAGWPLPCSALSARWHPARQLPGPPRPEEATRCSTSAAGTALPRWGLERACRAPARLARPYTPPPPPRLLATATTAQRRRSRSLYYAPHSLVEPPYYLQHLNGSAIIYRCAARVICRC